MPRIKKRKSYEAKEYWTVLNIFTSRGGAAKC